MHVGFDRADGKIFFRGYRGVIFPVYHIQSKYRSKSFRKFIDERKGVFPIVSLRIVERFVPASRLLFHRSTPRKILFAFLVSDDKRNKYL